MADLWTRRKDNVVRKGKEGRGITALVLLTFSANSSRGRREIVGVAAMSSFVGDGVILVITITVMCYSYSYDYDYDYNYS